MKHTEGKLRLNHYHFPHSFIVFDTDPTTDNDARPGMRKLCDMNTPHLNYKANAERVVQTWNACEGMEEPEKVIKALVEACESVDALVGFINEILSRKIEYEEMVCLLRMQMEIATTPKDAKAAIALAEGT